MSFKPSRFWGVQREYRGSNENLSSIQKRLRPEGQNAAEQWNDSHAPTVGTKHQIFHRARNIAKRKWLGKQ
jgi:hypothetical protein